MNKRNWILAASAAAFALTGAPAMAERGTGRLLYLNQAGRRMIGFTSDEEITQWRLHDIVPPWGQDLRENVCYPAVEARGSWTGESSLLTRDGREITVSESISLLPSRTDEVAECFAHIIRDITDQKRLEKEVLDIAEREQSRFGHDLHDDGDGPAHARGVHGGGLAGDHAFGLHALEAALHGGRGQVDLLGQQAQRYRAVALDDGQDGAVEAVQVGQVSRVGGVLGHGKRGLLEGEKFSRKHPQFRDQKTGAAK